MRKNYEGIPIRLKHYIQPTLRIEIKTNQYASMQMGFEIKISIRTCIFACRQLLKTYADRQYNPWANNSLVFEQSLLDRLLANSLEIVRL